MQGIREQGNKRSEEPASAEVHIFARRPAIGEKTFSILLEQRICYGPDIKTAVVVRFLMGCRDQVSTVRELADLLCDDSPLQAGTRAALKRLERVGRVAEIHPDMWHLE